MEDQTVSYEDYLEHYGVKGMKWGKRKNADGSTMSRKESKALNKSEQSAETARRVGSAKGSLRVRKTKVAAAIVGKTFATQIATQAASNAVGNLSKNRNVAAGAAVVNSAYSWNLTAAAVSDLASVARYKE